MAIALVGVVTSTGSSVAQDTSTLRVVPYADLRNLDPIWTTATITQNHGYMIYDTLFAMDESLTPQPQMVDTYEVSDDGLTYTFDLREGLTFHDGTPVEAQDVVASLNRWAARDNMGGALMEVTSSLSAVDADTIELVLTEPYGLVLDSLAKPVSNVPFIMPAEVAATDPFEQIDNYVGSGPFVFDEEAWVPGNKVVYRKFEDYVPREEPPSALAGGKVAKVDTVEWYYLPDPATAIAALRNDEVDFYESPPIDLVPVLEADGDIVVEEQDPYGQIVILRPNHLHPPFDKKEARQALAYMVNQTEYMTAMVGDPDFWQTCPSLMMCGTPVETSAGGGERMLDGNLEKAKELMASVYDGEKVVVMHPTDHPSGPTALVTASNLRKLGVDVELQAMDWATLTSRRALKEAPADGGWNIFHTRTRIGAASPVSHLAVSAGDTAWFGWPQNEKVEELRFAWATEPDAGKRAEIMDELHAELMEYQPFVMVGQYQMPSAWRSNVDGVLKAAALPFWNISVE
ncbi:ABC transporter substrate-binding protein [Acuticoccus sp.]|uniref:ABC transporter substrate-binding protein n=1 Tax=Acuticoccus sp. TaxID=1904378 RepID=UPI003B51964C